MSLQLENGLTLSHDMKKASLLLLCCSLIAAGEAYCPERGRYKIEEGRTCKRGCQDSSDCNAQNKGCFCDSECGLSCFNKTAACRQPSEIANGRISVSHLLWGGVVRYRCNDGFALKGRKSRKCNGDREWGGNEPTCESGCSRPNDVPNSYPSTGGNIFLVGNSFEFSCNTGYYKMGNSTRRCLSVREGWTDAQFSCIVKQCDALPHVRNGEILLTKSYEFGSTAKVTCDEGYEVTSDTAAMRCFSGDTHSSFGEWRGTLASCRIITCENPVAPLHGSILHLETIVAEFGRVITYQCDNGYKLEGNGRGRCNADRNWGEMPKCVENPDCSFTVSTAPFCGYQSRNWRRKMVADLRGLNGYAAESGYGHSFLESMQLPQGWAERYICLSFHYKLRDSTALKVESTDVSSETYLATHENERLSTWLNAAVTISARNNLSFQFHADGFGVLLDDVTVSPEACIDGCRSSPCRNGATCFTRMGGYTCFCTEDFEGRFCDSDKKCAEPTREITHGLRTSLSRGLLLPGSEAEYECDTGYRFHDGSNDRTKQIRCIGMGPTARSLWNLDPSNLICEEIKCETPSRGANRRLLNPRSKWLAGDIARFECAPRHIGWSKQLRRKVAMDAECLRDGRWSTHPPECIRPYCTYNERSESSSPKAVNPPPKYPEGSEIYFTCKAGYAVSGRSSLRCLETGKWDGNYPRCIKVECPQPARIQNVKYKTQKHSFVHRDTVPYGCSKGYFRQGPVVIRCLSNGTWSEARCSAVSRICPEESLNRPENGYWRLENPGKGILRCNAMYEASKNNDRIHCGLDGTWHGETPICKEIPPDGRAYIDGLEYLAFKTAGSANYSEAQGRCRNIGGNLAVIYDGTVRNGIVKMILEKIEPYELMFIGLKKTGRDFQWDTNDIPSDLSEDQRRSQHRFWHSVRFGEDLGGRNCVALKWDRDRKFRKRHQWYKTSCGDRLLFMCQRNWNSCTPNPCQNGGRCNSETRRRFTCHCNEKYKGRNCEIEITCDSSTIPKRGFKTFAPSNHTIGERVPLICDEGFESGFGEATCELIRQRGKATGEWRVEGSCRAITCGNPPLPDNGLIDGDTETYRVGDVIYIQCASGFEPYGNDVIQCQRDGSWTSLDMSCRRITCSSPHLPRGAHARPQNERYPVNARVEIFCGEGYRETGARSLVCQENKTWYPSEDQIICTEVDTRPVTAQPLKSSTITRHDNRPCEAPSLPSYSYIVDGTDDFPSGSSITLGCLEGKSITGGSDTLSCYNGTWTGTDAKCVALFCQLQQFSLVLSGFGIDEVELAGIDDKRFEVGRRLTLLCARSGSPIHYEDRAIQPEMTCEEGGQWSPSYLDFDCE